MKKGEDPGGDVLPQLRVLQELRSEAAWPDQAPLTDQSSWALLGQLSLLGLDSAFSWTTGASLGTSVHVL